MEIIQVGVTKIVDAITGKRRHCKYSDLPLEKDKWIVDPRYLPINYDLVDLWIANKRRVVVGIWNSKEWRGLRLREGDIITKWRRCETSFI